MRDSLRLTPPQVELLGELPDSPTEGKYLKGSRARTANSLVAKGLAKVVGDRDTNWYARTQAGRDRLGLLRPDPQHIGYMQGRGAV